MVDVVTVSAQRDPCGSVFAEENKAAGGTTLEWAEYRLCQLTHFVSDPAVNLWDSFAGEISSLWDGLENLYLHAESGAWNALSSGTTWLISAIENLWAQAKAAAGALHTALGDTLLIVGAVGLFGLLLWKSN